MSYTVQTMTVSRLLLLLSATASCAFVPAVPASTTGSSGHEIVQGRMLGLIRDTALKSSFADRQVSRLARTAEQPLPDRLRHAAHEFRRLGLSVSLDEVGEEAGALRADWSGRSEPGEIVLLAAHLEGADETASDHAPGVAAALGVLQVFNALRLKPRRTVRVMVWAGPEHGAQAASDYGQRYAASLTRHVAVVESAAGAGRPAGVLASLPDGVLVGMEPLMKTLMPMGAGTMERHSHQPLGHVIGPLLSLGLPGFVPVSNGLAAGQEVRGTPSLREDVAVLAALTWWLGEMPEPLLRVPAGAD
jgi:hypothetical protein